MTDQLLPPDPSKDGWYWANLLNGPWPCIIEWRTPTTWVTPLGALQPGGAWGAGYRLASPHPIPTPEQLNALCEMRDALSQGADEIRSVSPETASAWGTVVRELDDLFRGKPAPNDPPGNGLDDIRAAAMDQCGVPRAGEETAP